MRTVQCTYINRVSTSYFFLFFELIPILITDAFDKHLRIKINDKNFE